MGFSISIPIGDVQSSKPRPENLPVGFYYGHVTKVELRQNNRVMFVVRCINGELSTEQDDSVTGVSTVTSIGLDAKLAKLWRTIAESVGYSDDEIAQIGGAWDSDHFINRDCFFEIQERNGYLNLIFVSAKYFDYFKANFEKRRDEQKAVQKAKEERLAKAAKSEPETTRPVEKIQVKEDVSFDDLDGVDMPF